MQTIRPRELGLMMSGRAISHSEESPKSHARFLHGAQLWVALPDSDRHTDPHFEHHAELPVVKAPRALAGAIGRIAFLHRDQAKDPAEIDANYIRKADAE